MRRTYFMVLVLTVVLAATALNAPSALAQSFATHRAAKSGHRTARTSKTSKASERRTSHNLPPRKHAVAPCVTLSRTGRGLGHAASHTGILTSSRTRRHSGADRHPDFGSAEAVSSPAHRAPEPESTAPKTHVRAASPPAVLPLAAPAPAAVPEPQTVSFHWNRHVVPPPMRGSLESLERQNDRANADGLERIEDEADLSDRIASGALVPVPVSAALAINPDLSEHHRYCRLWTARFLSDLARAHDAQFHAALEVSSAVRTVEYQKHLIAINGNAAPAEGDVASPHLTGATVDIAKSVMGRQEIGWMRSFLTPLQATGKIDVEEEFQQSCFHITVYKSYVPARTPRSTQPKSRPGNAEVAGGQSALGR